MNQLGYSTDELFDEVFLSYAMRKEKPSVEIYEEMTQQTGLNPATTLYFDDRTENAEAGKRFWFPECTNKVQSSGRASGMARN